MSEAIEDELDAPILRHLKKNHAGTEPMRSETDHKKLYRAFGHHQSAEAVKGIENFNEEDWKFIDGIEEKVLATQEKFDWELDEGLKPSTPTNASSPPHHNAHWEKPKNLDLFERGEVIGIDLPLFAFKTTEPEDLPPKVIETVEIIPEQTIEDFLQETKQQHFNKLAEEEIGDAVPLPEDEDYELWDKIEESDTKPATEDIAFLPDDLDEYQENLRDYVGQSIQIEGKIDYYARVYQVASEFAAKYDFSVPLLEEIFATYGWGNTRVAVEGLLQKGCSERALKLVFELRNLWEQYYGRPLTWGIASHLCNYFGEEAGIEEIEMRLLELQDEWSESRRLRYRFKDKFFSFLMYTINVMGDGLWPWIDSTEEHLEDDSSDDLRCLPGSLTHIQLNREGMLCDMWRNPLHPSWPRMELEKPKEETPEKKQKKRKQRKKKKL